MVRYSQDSVAAAKSPPIFPHRLLRLKAFQKMKAKLLKDESQCTLMVQGETKRRGFIACTVSIEELASWRRVPESKVAGMLFASPQNMLSEVEMTPNQYCHWR